MTTPLETAELLFGHTDQENALVVPDYPFGFHLRCKIRYWIETHPKHGDRFCSQTTNPKVAGERWNKPKKSTYCEVGVMFREEGTGHIKWTGLHSWPKAPQLEVFERRCWEHLNVHQRSRLHHLIMLHKVMALRELVREVLDAAEQRGRDAYAVEGATRVAPAGLWVDGPVAFDPQLAVKAWYAGWDKAADAAALAAVCG